MRCRTVVLTAMAVGVLVTSAAIASPSGAVPADRDADRRPAPTVRVESGLLRGTVGPDTVAFSDVPYAAPPVGERRFAPPAAPEPWDGVREVGRSTSRCPQPPQGADDPTVIGHEDCLHLNVTVPRDRDRRPHRGLPVLVWLYGGNFIDGAASDYGPARLAAEGDLVVVTVNYRLGALGYLSSPALDAGGPTSGNFGIEDQAAALRWVQRNIAEFGGDAGNVTLAGQSAGSRAVCAHLASPASRGLFDKVILQSGGCANEAKSKSLADEHGRMVAAEVGCADATDVAACLRAAPLDDLLDTLDGVGGDLTDRAANDPWGPVVGTSILPVQPGEAIADGSSAGVPMLIGTNRDEMSAFVGYWYDARGNPLSVAAYEQSIVGAFGDQAPAVLAEYPAASFPSPALALSAVLGDWGGTVGACPAYRTAQAAAPHAPVYAYELQEDSGLVELGYPLGSFHGWDLKFLFDLYMPNGYPELTADQQRLARDLRARWAAFVHHGVPSERGQAWWPAFRPWRDTVVGISTQSFAPTPFAADHRCGLWASM